MKGRWIHALGGGAPHVFSTRLLRSTRFLKAICYKKANKKNNSSFLKNNVPHHPKYYFISNTTCKISGGGGDFTEEKFFHLVEFNFKVKNFLKGFY